MLSCCLVEPSTSEMTTKDHKQDTQYYFYKQLFRTMHSLIETCPYIDLCPTNRL